MHDKISTAWMVRRDGKAIPCIQHIYADLSELQQLDKIVQSKIPSGMNIRRIPHRFAEHAEIVKSSDGYNKGTFRSVTVKSNNDLTEFIGSVLWVCKSPHRKGHKRKNWYIDFKACNQTENAKFAGEKFNRVY